MMVAAIDQRDLDRCAGKAEGGFQSAKAGADNHHAMEFFRRCNHAMRPRFGYWRAWFM
jgi:hypothetical protein